MPWDWTTGELAAGLNCYRKEEFFDAHEHWENIWRQSHGPEKPFLQALIQLAGALHHHRRKNPRGAQALLRAAMSRLEPYPERYGGVLLAPLRQELAAWLQALEANQALANQASQGQALANQASMLPTSSPPCPESYPKIQLDPGDP